MESSTIDFKNRHKNQMTIEQRNIINAHKPDGRDRRDGVDYWTFTTKPD